MTHLILKTGDLFTTHSRGIGHGVNVDGMMGAGIAVVFRKRFPAMYGAYAAACMTGALEPGGVFIWEEPNAGFIYNIASQDRPGANAHLGWLDTGVREALAHADEHGITSISLPRIGCGIGGLDWEAAQLVLANAAKLYSCDIEVWTQE